MRKPSGDICTSSAYSSWKTSMDLSCLKGLAAGGSAAEETETSARAANAAHAEFFMIFSRREMRLLYPTGPAATTRRRRIRAGARAGFALLRELGAQRNLRVQHLGHRAARLGLFGDFH